MEDVFESGWLAGMGYCHLSDEVGLLPSFIFPITFARSHSCCLYCGNFSFLFQNTLPLIKDPKFAPGTDNISSLGSIHVCIAHRGIRVQLHHFATQSRLLGRVGIWAFAAYWLVKTKEMLGPDIEKLIAEKGVKAVICEELHCVHSKLLTCSLNRKARDPVALLCL